MGVGGGVGGWECMGVGVGVCVCVCVCVGGWVGVSVCPCPCPCPCIRVSVCICPQAGEWAKDRMGDVKSALVDESRVLGSRR